MDARTTLLALVPLVVLAAFCGWRGARPPDLSRGPRLIPWRPIMVAAATAAFLLLIHLINLLGVETGGQRPLN